MEDPNLIRILPARCRAAQRTGCIGVDTHILQSHNVRTGLASQCNGLIAHLRHLSGEGIVECILCTNNSILTHCTTLLHEIAAVLRVDRIVHEANIVHDLSILHEQRDRRGVIVLAEDIAVNRVSLCSVRQRLNVEGQIGVHVILIRAILQEILDRELQTLARLANVEHEDRGLVLEESLVDICLNKERITRQWDRQPELDIVVCLVMLRVLAEVFGELVQWLCTRWTPLMCLQHPLLELGDVLRLTPALSNHVVAVPQLLFPSTGRNPLLVHGDGFGEPSQTIVRLCKVEHVPTILRLILQTLLQEPGITLKLIGLASTIVAVVDVAHRRRQMLRRTIPVLVRHTATRPVIVHANQSCIGIFQSTGLLDYGVSLVVKGSCLEVLRNKDHVRIQQKAICVLEIPSRLLQVGLGVLETDRAIVTKVLPGLHCETAIVGLEILRCDLS